MVLSFMLLCILLMYLVTGCRLIFVVSNMIMEDNTNNSKNNNIP
jgi:hypothetical protein